MKKIRGGGIGAGLCWRMVLFIDVVTTLLAAAITVGASPISSQTTSLPNKRTLKRDNVEDKSTFKEDDEESNPHLWYRRTKRLPPPVQTDSFSKSTKRRHLSETMDPEEFKQRAREVMSTMHPNKETLTKLSSEELSSHASKAAEAEDERNRRLRAAGGGGRRQNPRDAHNDNEEEENKEENYGWLRRAGWGGENYYEPYSDSNLASPGEYYDKWAQGYRMLGGFIDCDHKKDQDDRRRRRRRMDGEQQNERDLSGSGDDRGDDYGCSRWMMWAAYVNPNYQGGEYEEYFPSDDTESPISSLDCHSANTEWELLGVYRQEFYQYIEQISKHLWAIDEYDYIVALAGLAYMSDYDCFHTGNYDGNGNSIYAGVEPLEAGYWQMQLYSDQTCLEKNSNSGYSFDDFGYGSDPDLGSKDEGDDGRDESYVYETWYATQEATLTMLNEVYDTFKYCTLCMDYPTYQDGYFIGDYGIDDDDIINQCWKFHSHDSFACEAECIHLGDKQGTILQVHYGDKTFGASWSGSSQSSTSDGSANANNHNRGSATRASSVSRLDKLKANIFVTLSGILFVATALAFAVARGSGAPLGSTDRSGKTRSLLTDEEKEMAQMAERSNNHSNSRRSKSRSKRSSSRHRSKSRHRDGRSSSHRASNDDDNDNKERRSRSKPKRSSSSRKKHSDGGEKKKSSSRRNGNDDL